MVSLAVDWNIKKSELEGIYQTISESQRELFAEQFKKLVQIFVDERKESRQDLHLVNDSVEFRKMYRELYILSIKSLSSYFGVHYKEFKDERRENKRISGV